MTQRREDGATFAEIGKDYGITGERVRQILRKGGAESVGETRRIDNIVQRYIAGETVTDIASSVNLRPETVSRWIRSRGVAIRKTSIDPERRREIAGHYAASRSAMSTAKELGVAFETVLKVAREFGMVIPPQGGAYRKKDKGQQ